MTAELASAPAALPASVAVAGELLTQARAEVPALRTLDDPDEVTVSGPALAHLDVVDESPLDETAMWRLVAALGRGKAREVL
ncbi:MAG: hypothetical protein GEV00_22800, partial [Actinophytocola sp.]|nr:hypothetical protein [Actinophytocola sp.]